MIINDQANRRPARSRLRYARLTKLFPGSIDKLTNSRIARLCVLFEDLRIELAGSQLPGPGPDETRGLVAHFDVAGCRFRELYFLRRSIATCFEFAEALRLVDACPGFQKLLSHFPADDQNTWRDSIGYFHDHEKFWKDVRNDVGGHFGSEAAAFAVRSFLPEAVGGIEFQMSYSGAGGVVLGFASEVVATALMRHLPGASPEDKVKALFDEVLRAFPRAVRAVECIVINYLWARTDS